MAPLAAWVEWAVWICNRQTSIASAESPANAGLSFWRSTTHCSGLLSKVDGGAARSERTWWNACRLSLFGCCSSNERNKSSARRLPRDFVDAHVRCGVISKLTAVENHIAVSLQL